MKLSQSLFILFSFLSFLAQAEQSIRPPASILKLLPQRICTKLEQKILYQKKQKVTPYPHFCESLDRDATEEITIKPIDATNTLSFTMQEDANKGKRFIYKYRGIDPLFTMECEMDTSTAKEILDYLYVVEREKLKQKRICGAHRDILFDALRELFDERLQERAQKKKQEQEQPPELNQEDIFLRIDDRTTLKWVDVVDSEHSFRVHLYRFVCGNLNCTIRYGLSQKVPQIRWSCQTDTDECPLSDKIGIFRDLTDNEIFHFLIILSEHDKPIPKTLLSKDQQLLTQQMLACLKPKYPDSEVEK